MKLDNLEWQYIGDDNWIFGKKIRGIVRDALAEIYFTEGDADKQKDYGWKWFVRLPIGMQRGREASLRLAVEAAEQMLRKAKGKP